MKTVNSTTKRELQQTVQALDKLQAKAVANRQRFLAYLLDMARMEAVSLLTQQRQQS